MKYILPLLLAPVATLAAYNHTYTILTDFPSLVAILPACVQSCYGPHLLAQGQSLILTPDCPITGDKGEKVDWACLCDGTKRPNTTEAREVKQKAVDELRTCLKGVREDDGQCEWADESDAGEVEGRLSESCAATLNQTNHSGHLNETKSNDPKANDGAEGDKNGAGSGAGTIGIPGNGGALTSALFMGFVAYLVFL
ncbi:hypothetical protein BJ508DRAFT_379201 [Ascobolus immersus RN42]|uniref:Extracellular membrane protein CFEM domain-containing protein n=1 Tax=Ascobolus immersus RN42 TaxID=1160509 RepID=A0A3N4HYE7_ASCIM|nr:hypothetical protein BJ508DRAFT_379201 [Ascobolus immersus RN42]